jgi:hypothetical protein
MSDDKKTVVGTFTDGETVPDCYHLMILQITGQTYPAGTVSAGTAAHHVLASGPSSSAFWLHYTGTTESSGIMTFSEFVASNPEISPAPGIMTGYIDASGIITIDGNPTYHGQVSDDLTFSVGTQTFLGESPTPFYGLTVSTEVASDTIGHDFNGDGKADILWYNTSGTTALWLMDGTTTLSTAIIGSAPTDWQIKGVGDFNGDGKADILWYNTSGTTALWLMDGTTTLSTAIIGSAPTDWQIINN